MEKFIQCIKTLHGDKYEVMVSIPHEAYGIQWYIVEDTDKLKYTAIEKETRPICCLRSDEIKNYEGKWLCCDYTLGGMFHQEVALYFSSDTLTMIRKNHFDTVSFYDKTSGRLMHEAEYRYRYKDGEEV